ncbi:helix-turn-helix domain-containing protein [Streptomyces sp. NPDC049906]|uniref:AraC family transcriptional regulator n=1 Tax=Streptomyces sp. NPDC049906 TaxID=3155656 RepID=UPI00344024F1
MTPRRSGARSPAHPSSLDFPLRIPGVDIPERVHHDEHMALWQIRGSTLVRCGETSVEISEGEVIWLPAGTRHSLEVRANSVLFPLSISVDEIATVLTAITVVPIRNDEKIYFLALHQSQSTVIQPSANIQRQVLSILERRVLAPDDLPLPTSPGAAAVAGALLFNPGDDRRILDWAREVGTSGRSLERAFVAETGLTFGQWRTRSRMHAAARLLRAGSSVVSVTQRVGYEDPSGFARAFRDFYGMSPTAYATPPDRD